MRYTAISGRGLRSLRTIELTFRQSFCGGLKQIARRASPTVQPSFPVGDVFCCPVDLSRGEIAGDLWTVRLREVQSRDLGWLEAAEQKRCRDFGVQQLQQAQEDVVRWVQRFEGGEAVRLWVSPQVPSEVCGACWVLSLLNCRSGRVVLCSAPTRESWDTESFQCWSECPEERIGLCAATREIPSEERQQAASRWQVLCEENAPLRAVVNGLLVSVPADFYDAFVRQVLAHVNEPMPVARVVGKALCHPGLYHLGDAFILSRLWALKQAGEVDLFKGAEAKPRTWIRRLT